MLEETGYEVKLGVKLRVEHNTPSHALHSFRANIVGGELSFPRDELLDARWFTIEEIEELNRAGKIRVEWVIRSIQDARQASFLN